MSPGKRSIVNVVNIVDNPKMFPVPPCALLMLLMISTYFSSSINYPGVFCYFLNNSNLNLSSEVTFSDMMITVVTMSLLNCVVNC